MSFGFANGQTNNVSKLNSVSSSQLSRANAVSPIPSASVASSAAQTLSKSHPKLIVGIVVDQMRWDFLYRFSAKYGGEGFARLMRDGYNCENVHYNYVPTYTAVGHSCIYTGSIPSVDGIIGNDWYERSMGRQIYCTEDNSVNTVGGKGSGGQMSPKRMLTNTIGDELKIAGNFRSKVIGVAIKDRSSILPAGHSADAAYWFDGPSGGWVTSTYYRNDLPDWVKAQNESLMKDKTMLQTWQTIMALEKYEESSADNVRWEGNYSGETNPVFPHNMQPSLDKGMDILRALPYGNTMTFNMAKAAIEGEKLGVDEFADLLAVSLSSTDIIGHQFGPNSVEIEDTYLRLDKDLASFLSYLDLKVGKGNYTVFLTADHGAANNATYCADHKIPSGNILSDSLRFNIQSFLGEKFGNKNLVTYMINQQIYLNKEEMKGDDTKESKVKEALRAYLLTLQGVSDVIDLSSANQASFPQPFRDMMVNSYNARRSGDLYIVMQPGWLENYVKGTTHGTMYPYDTHVPLLWYGWGVKPGKDFDPLHVCDIAPTLAALLHIQEPNGTVGVAIPGLLKY